MSSTLVYDWIAQHFILFIVTDGAKQPLGQQIAQLAAPRRDERLFTPEVEARADELYGPRPYRLTIERRRKIAAELAAERT